MIELPPSDPVLNGMRLALDGAAMTDLLDGRLDRLRVRSCNPYYVKYKRGRYCRVQYELDTLDSDSGRTAREVAHVSLYSPARARKLAAKNGASGSIPGAAYIADLSAIAQRFPFDVALPGLSEAVSPPKMTRRLRRALPWSGRDLSSCHIELVRYKAEKRAVLKYRLDGSSGGCVYGKLRKDGAASLSEVPGALRRAGVPTPKTLAFFADLGLVVQAEADGVRLSDLRGTPSYQRWMPEVAEELARLHDTTIQSLPRYKRQTDADELLDEAATIGTLVPSIASQTEALARRLVSMLGSTKRAPAPTHGSFHDDQVLVSEQGATFVDVDRAMLADPLIDVGHFLSYLSAEGAVDAREEFLNAYVAARGDTGDFHLIYESASLLRWATLPFRELRPGWPHDVERRVRCANDRLKG
jgi:aminoglycoside phosphotransferase